MGGLQLSFSPLDTPCHTPMLIVLKKKGKSQSVNENIGKCHGQADHVKK
jgi:hypothetical protein